MNGRKLVAWNLRRLRVGQRLSQEKLAADAGVDRAYMSRLERELENPTVALLDRLASALSAHISEFFVEPKPGRLDHVHCPADGTPNGLYAGRKGHKRLAEAFRNRP
jgi:transcriptional regulator with XRE-family HTH domain